MKILIVILSIIFLGCSSNSDNKYSKSYPKNKNDSIVSNWKADSLGCLGFRNDSSIKYIFSKYSLKDKDKAFLEEVFGLPNEEYQTEAYFGLRYYCNGGCKEGRISKDADKCWYEILVSRSHKEDAGYAKGCQ